MSRNEIVIDATPEQVWDVLMNPWLYTLWVVGNKRVRGADADWPAIGSRFHHTVGVGPLMTRDATRIVELRPREFLELDAHAWPVGTARVALTLEPAEGGTRVIMVEEPTRGPARWMENPLLHGLTHGRNVESLRRLKRVVEQRVRQKADAP